MIDSSNSLTNEQQYEILKLEKKYFESIANNNFKVNCRKVGLEIEFSIIDNHFWLIPETTETIINEADDRYITQELGSYQIEINPPPIMLNNNTFQELYEIFSKKIKKICDIANNHEWKILPIGIPFKIDYEALYKSNIFSKNLRYIESANYFSKNNKNGSVLAFSNDNYKNIIAPGNSGVTLINELHIHLQALDVNDVLDLFNYSQMLTAPFLALGANSGITNGLKLKNKEHQIKIFEQAEGIYDGSKEIPRVGLFPGYIKNIKDFFDIALSFKPIHRPSNKNAETAFQLALGKYFSWVRIRYESEPSPNLRIEFRPLSTQPTLNENIELSYFFIKSLLFYISHNKELIPEKYLRKNFDIALKNGLNSDLYWIFDKQILKVPVCKILEYMSQCVKLTRISEDLCERIMQKQSPTDKIIEMKNNIGYHSTVKKYIDTFYQEIE